MLIRHAYSSPYASSYALGGLGSIPGVTCTATLCKGSADPTSTDPTKTKFGPLQAAINEALATFNQLPVPKLVTDGKIGTNTVAALAALGTSAEQYAMAGAPTLVSYGVKPPTKTAVAAAAGVLIDEVKAFTRLRLADQNAPDDPDAALAAKTAAQTAAQAAQAAKEYADALSIASPGSPRAAQAAAVAEQARVKATAAGAVAKATSGKAWGVLPKLSGRASTDRLIYGVAAMGGVWALYRYTQMRDRVNAAPRAAAAPMAGARRRRRW